MDSLHAEQCEPQMKIAIFVNAIRNTFFQQNETSTIQTQTTEQPMMTLDASTTMDLVQTSTKQTQTIEQPKMEQNPSKKTASSETDDTDSAYNTDTEHLPRPHMQQKPAKARHFHTVKHPNHCEAAYKNISSIYIPAAYKENTAITYSTITSKTFQLQRPVQTTHYKTISI